MSEMMNERRKKRGKSPVFFRTFAAQMNSKSLY